jgi:Na+/melibiose symporter-like transporter
MKKMSEIEKKEKFDLKHTFFIGLVFFPIILAWEMYDSQVSVSLYNYLGVLALVGLILGLDNLIGLIIQPIMGNISDNTRTRYGRRLPYLIIGIPLSALFFALIAFETSLFTLILFIFCFITSMTFYRIQTVALIPDFIKPEHRSKGNAILNLMGGMGAIFAAIICLIFVDISLQLAFIIIALIMITMLIICLLTVKEKDAYAYQLCLEMDEKDEKYEKVVKFGLIESFKDILSEKDKSTFLLLLAVFCVFMGYGAFRSLFTIYGMNVLGLSRGAAGGKILYAAIMFLIMAFPSAILAEKFGKNLIIKIGLIIFIGALLFGFIIRDIAVIDLVLIFIGVGFALINVNALVVLWDLAPSEEKIGTYTGVYYFFMSSAAIFGPGLVGAITDLLGLNYLFLVCSLFLISALVLMFFVKREKVELTEKERLARQKAIQELK